MATFSMHRENRDLRRQLNCSVKLLTLRKLKVASFPVYQCYTPFYNRKPESGLGVRLLSYMHMTDLVCIESPFVSVLVGLAEVTPSLGAAAVLMRAVRHSLTTMSPLFEVK